MERVNRCRLALRGFRKSDVAADKIAPERMSGVHHHKAARRWINNKIARLGDGADQTGDQAARLGMRVRFAIDLLRPAIGMP